MIVTDFPFEGARRRKWHEMRNENFPFTSVLSSAPLSIIARIYVFISQASRKACEREMYVIHEMQRIDSNKIMMRSSSSVRRVKDVNA